MGVCMLAYTYCVSEMLYCEEKLSVTVCSIDRNGDSQ